MKKLIKKSWKNVIIVVLFIVAYASTVLLVQNYISGPKWWLGIFTFGYPNYIPSLHTLIALENFGGAELEAARYWMFNILIITGLISTLVVIPFVYLKGNIAENKYSESYPITWYVGSALIVMAMVVMTASAGSNVYYYSTTWSLAEKNAKVDDARDLLSEVSFKAAELMVLPEAYGGVKENYQNLKVDQLLETQKSGYEIVVGDIVPDSMVTIHIVADFEGESQSYKNINGETGKFELAMKVNPQNDKLIEYSYRNRLGFGMAITPGSI